MPQLDPTWFASQLFWLAITFVLLYIVMSRFVLPPLLDIIERRQQTIADDVAKAHDFTAQAELARKEYEQALAEARGRAQSLMNDASHDAKAKSEQQMRLMDQKVDGMLKDAARSITAKKEELMSSLTPAAMELTAMIVEKLTQRAPGNAQVDQVVGKIAKGRR